jgi:hypothetical protein
MSVAFVGASEQVVTGDDAFERANDEVGIYEVRDVDIEVTDVPEPDEPEQPSGRTDANGGTDASSGGGAGSGGAGKAGGPGSASGGGTESSSADHSPGESDSPDDVGATSRGTATDAASTDAATDPSGDTEREVNGQAPPSGTQAAANESTEPSSSADSTADRSTASHIEAAEPAAGGEQSATPEAETDPTESEGDPTESEVESAESATETDARAPETGASASGQTDAGATTSEPETPRRTESKSSDQTEPSATPSALDSTRETGTDDGTDEQGTDGAFADEEEWRETTTIPSLDPDRSEGPGGAAAGESAGSAGDGASTSSDRTSGKSATGRSQSDERANADSASHSPSNERSASSAASGSKGSPGASETAASASDSETTPSAASGTGGANGGENTTGGASGGSSGEVSEEAKERVRKLRSQLEQRKQQVQKLEERVSDVESERNEYKRERDALRQEVERLEAKLETAGSSGSASGKRQLDTSQAFDGTNLFVRYESKGKATLDEAAEGKVEAGDVNANLRLEHHTQFEADEVEVGGEAFESFLTDSFEYRFVSWIIEELLYEIRDTGHRASLKDLYESIPKIDRVDLHGSVSAGSTDDDTRQESFDIIMRDRMGNPLLVADLNDSRDPTTGEMMGSLVESSSGVGQAHGELSGAFQVTESFFEPEALETAESATSGGFLSREKRESFVKLSRKRGYHLCLVESRSGGFHLNVPEL